MKAIRIHQYGSIDNVVLEEIPVPKIGLDEVLVQVEAASINPLDVKLISGNLHAYFPLTMPYAVGTDLSGTVVEVGLLATRISHSMEEGRPRHCLPRTKTGFG